ncbi:hypothetical protein BKA64DRAFT_570396 [Cadophora sp. MPI-SDFR-AT-0126]|nr:hypothetical protein BKA64DRAFT_570396 [Leotiomycetes sp. MPI-SDFR-AT-0126]
MPLERLIFKVNYITFKRQIQITNKKITLCTYYENTKYKDYISPRDLKLTRCGRYTRLNKTCDIRLVNRIFTAFDEESLDSQIKKLKNEKDTAIVEFHTRLAKLKKQKRFLYKRRQKMIITGLNSINKLDTLETLEKKRKKKES